MSAKAFIVAAHRSWRWLNGIHIQKVLPFGALFLPIFEFNILQKYFHLVLGHFQFVKCLDLVTRKFYLLNE